MGIPAGFLGSRWVIGCFFCRDAPWGVRVNTELCTLSCICFQASDAKGLEFEAVVVLCSGMEINEQYIAYTRALDHLCIVKDHTFTNEGV